MDRASRRARSPRTTHAQTSHTAPASPALLGPARGTHTLHAERGTARGTTASPATPTSCLAPALLPSARVGLPHSRAHAGIIFRARRAGPDKGNPRIRGPPPPGVRVEAACRGITKERARTRGTLPDTTPRRREGLTVAIGAFLGSTPFYRPVSPERSPTQRQHAVIH